MRSFRFLSSISGAVMLLGLLSAAGSLASCSYTVKSTTVEVKDSLRHYFPVLVKEEMRLSFDITNTGAEPLVITEVQPSCSAIKLASVKPEIVPPGATETLNFIFTADKNIGYAKHDIRVFGNIYPDGYTVMTFDVHVVRPTLDGSDYEEIFQADLAKHKELVDGKMWEKGYWTGDYYDEFQ